MNPALPQAAAVLLAAGASTRMGRPKPLLEFEGETFLDRQLRLYSGCCRSVLTVLGFAAETIAAGLREPGEAVFVLNPRPERGQLSSLQCGLRALPACEVFFFLPIDAPGVRMNTLTTLLAACASSPNALLAVPRHGGRHGHPVLARAALIAEFLALDPGAMARDVVHAHRDRTIYVDVDDASIHHDIDDAAAYRALIEEERP